MEKERKEKKKKKKSDSPSSSPPAPPLDSTPPTNSVPPPTPATDSSPPPPIDSSPPPPPSSTPPPPPEPTIFSPPPPSQEDSTPPESTNSPPPPVEFESPPAPPNEDNNPSPPPPPPEPTVFSPPPPSQEDSPPPESTNSPPPPVEFESPPATSNEDDNPPPLPPEQLPPPAPSPLAGPQRTPPGPTKSPSPQNSPPLNTSHALPPPKPTPNGPPDLPSSSQNSVPPPPNGYQGKTIAGMAVAGFAIIALMAVLFLVRRKKKRNKNSQYLPPAFSIKGYSDPNGYNSQQQFNTRNSFGSKIKGYTRSGSAADSSVMGSSQIHFTYEELMDITEGFGKQNIIGEGGFGSVYKGKLNDGKLVAVKQLKVGSGQGDREFKAEVEIISRVHHRHLVSLVGYCISESERLLIYEYVPNQTLEYHLHGEGVPVLEWAKRVRIAVGSAKGLAYLHEDCHPKIIHRDIKSANILLDDDFEAQVADFGLARLNDSTQTHVSTRVLGTFGYLAPEYAQSGKLTDRSDVFSFGVVLLELITGRKSVDQSQPLGKESLVEWARPLLHKAIETGDFSELVDKRLEKHYVENEVFRMIEIAAACVRQSGPERPRMVQVARALDSEGEMGDISNGIKVGQNSTYDSAQYNKDIMKLRKIALGLDDCSDSGMYSGDYSRKGSNDEFENRK